MGKLKDWRKATSAQEVIDCLKQKPWAKSTALCYFCDVADDEKIVGDLLKSGFYTPDEVANMTNYYWSNAEKITPARQLVVDFADPVWQNSNDADFIFNLPMGVRYGFAFGNLFVHKMRYFEEHNQDMYFALIDRGFNDGSVQSQNKKLAYVEMIKHYDYYKDMILITAIGNSIFYDILLSQRNVPSISKDLAEMEEKLEKGIRGRWEHLTSPQVIMYKATEENKWEILEFFAKYNTNAFWGLIKYYSTKTKSRKRVTFSNEEIIERYGNVDLETLPGCLKQYVELCLSEVELDKLKKEEKKQIKQLAETDKDKWYDDFGELKTFFRIGKIPIYSKEEYIKIAYKLIKENMTIGMFCWKYGIDNAKGFEEMLNLLAEEDSHFAEVWKEQRLVRQKEYIINAKKFIEGVAFKKLPVSEMIENSTMSFEKLQDIAEKYYDNKIADAFTANVIKYYYDRLNCTAENNVEKIGNMLTKNEVKFLVGIEEYAEIVKLNKRPNLAKTINDRIKTYGSRNQSSYISGLVHGKWADKITRKLERDYGSVFDKDKYNKSENFIMHNGQQIRVTNEMIDQAFHYIKVHELYPNDITMRMVIKAVACGEIDVSKETKVTKAMMRAKALKLCENVYSLDNYFKIIDENSLE